MYKKKKKIKKMEVKEVVVEKNIRILRKFTSKSGKEMFQLLVEDEQSPDVVFCFANGLPLEVGKVYKAKLRLSPRFVDMLS